MRLLLVSLHRVIASDFPSGWISPEGKFRRIKGDWSGEGHADALLSWKVFEKYIPWDQIPLGDPGEMSVQEYNDFMERVAGEVGKAGSIAVGRAGLPHFTLHESVLMKRRHL